MLHAFGILTIALHIGMAARALTSPRAHYNITILRDARRHGAYLQDKVLLYDVCALAAYCWTCKAIRVSARH